MISRLKASSTIDPLRLDYILGKSTLLAIFLFFNFMVTFRVLLVSVVPEVELVAEALYEAIILLYLVYRLSLRVVSGNLRLNSLELYLVLMFFLPVIAANGARAEFGQPMIYGILTFRDFYLIFGGLIVYNMLRTNTVTIQLVEKMLVLTAWINVLMFYFMSLFVDPRQFIETGLAGANDAKGGDVYFRFNMAYIFFGSIYYFVKAFYRKNFKYLILGAVFLFYVTFFRFDRTSMASVFGALAMFFVTALTPRRQLMWILIGFIPILFLVTSVYFVSPELFEQYYLMFADAFATLLGTANAEGEESVRLNELRIALEHIEKNPLIGNGKVSNQWVEGGYSHFLGFFYASDVGIFGQIFMYGFIGAFLLYFQFLLSLNYALKIRHIKRNVFLVSLKFMMFAIMLDSITNGYLTIYAAQSVTALILIYYFYQKDFIIGAELREKKLEQSKILISRQKHLDENHEAK